MPELSNSNRDALAAAAAYRIALITRDYRGLGPVPASLWYQRRRNRRAPA